MEIQAAIVLVLVFFLMLTMSVPVSFSIISASLLTIIMSLASGLGILVSAQKIISGIDGFTLLAVPSLVLAGLLMNSDGIVERLINPVMLFLGKVPGSLAMTNTTDNTMFGSVSGSDITAVTATGGVILPSEEEQGYDEGFSAVVNMAAVLVGRLVPPTASFIVYSATSGDISVMALLIADWVSGFLQVALCMATACVYGAKHEYVMGRGKMSAAIIVKTIWEAIPGLFLIVIIIGGILPGHFISAETSGVAAAYALFLSVSVYRSIQTRGAPKILVDTTVIITIVMPIIGASSVLPFVLSFTGLPQAISSLPLGVFDNRIVILLIIDITLLIVGAFMDMAPILLIFTPIFLPIVRSLGMDPIQLGVMVVTNLSIDTITSPVGNVLFVGYSVAKLQVEDVMKKPPPSFVVAVTALMFITFVPGSNMWLPGVLGSLK